MLFLTAVITVWVLFFFFWILSANRNRQSVKYSEPFASRFLNIVLYGVTAAMLLYDWRIAAPLSARFIPDHCLISLTGFAIQAAGLGFALWA